MSTVITHSCTVDGVACLDPSSIASGRAALGYPPFSSYAISERGLKPTYARVVMRRADVAARFATRDFNHTLVWSDSSGRSMTFPRLGFHFAESAFDQFADGDDDPMIVTLTDIRRFWGMTNVEKRYNILHPIMDGETYYESTLKTDGEDKVPWNWVEVIKNLWESVVGPSPILTFSTADLAVDTSDMNDLTVITEPDADGRLLAQPRNLKFRGPFYGVMSWIAEHLHHEFLYDHQLDSWAFVPFDPDSPFISGANSGRAFHAFLDANVDRFGSLSGAGRTPPTPKPQYFNVPKEVVFKFPKANYDFNGGQTNEDSDIGYQSLNKYLDVKLELIPSSGAAEKGVRVLYDPMPAIYETNGTQKEDSDTRIEQHTKKRKKLLENEYDLTGTYNRLRLGGLPSNLTYPDCNQSLMAMMVRHFPSSAVAFEVAQGSNRFGDFLLFYREYGVEFFDFRKEWHKDLAWEPNEEYVAHHRAYVELTEDLDPGKWAEAKLIRFYTENENSEDEDEIRHNHALTNKLLIVKNPYYGSLKAETRLQVVVSRDLKGWVPEQALPECMKMDGSVVVLTGADAVITRDTPEGDKYALVPARRHKVEGGLICESSDGIDVRINICECTDPCVSNHITDVMPNFVATDWCHIAAKTTPTNPTDISDLMSQLKFTVTGHGSWRGNLAPPHVTDAPPSYAQRKKTGVFSVPVTPGNSIWPDSSQGFLGTPVSGRFIGRLADQWGFWLVGRDETAFAGPNGWKETSTTLYIRRQGIIYRAVAGCDTSFPQNDFRCTLDEKILIEAGALAWFDVPDTVQNPWANRTGNNGAPRANWDAGLLLGGGNTTRTYFANTNEVMPAGGTVPEFYVILNFNLKRVWDTEEDKTNDTDNWCDVWEFGPPSDAIEAFTALDNYGPGYNISRERQLALLAMMSYPAWIQTAMAMEAEDPPANEEFENTPGPQGVDTPFDYSYFHGNYGYYEPGPSGGYGWIGLTQTGASSFSRTVAAENGTDYTIALAANDLTVCGSGTGSGSDFNALCCTTMPAAGDIGAAVFVTALSDGVRRRSDVGFEGGDGEEYASSNQLPTGNPAVTVTLFFECEQGALHFWAEDEDGNVYDLGRTTDYECDPFSVSIEDCVIPELNVSYDINIQ